MLSMVLCHQSTFGETTWKNYGAVLAVFSWICFKCSKHRLVVVIARETSLGRKARQAWVLVTFILFLPEEEIHLKPYSVIFNLFSHLVIFQLVKINLMEIIIRKENAPWNRRVNSFSSPMVYLNRFYKDNHKATTRNWMQLIDHKRKLLERINFLISWVRNIYFPLIQWTIWHNDLI